MTCRKWIHRNCLFWSSIFVIHSWFILRCRYWAGCCEYSMVIINV